MISGQKKSAYDDFVPVIDHTVFQKCTPDWYLVPEMVKGYEVIYLTKGRIRYIIDGKSYELGPGDFLYLTSGMEKEAAGCSPAPMHFFTASFSSFSPHGKSPPFPIINNIGLRQEVVDLWKELTSAWNEQQSGYVFKTRALFMLILHRFGELTINNTDSLINDGDFRISKAIRTIAANYSEKLTVKKLADQVQLNEVYFGQLFKQNTGMTVQQYIIRERIRNAEAILQNGGCKIHEVAETCGFSDVVHFYKMFKAIRGFPPSRCLPRNSKPD